MAKWTPLSSRPGIGKSRGLRSAAGQQQRVVLRAQFVDRDVHAHVGMLRNSTPSAPICSNAPPDARFFQLEVGDAVHQQSARPIGPLEHGDLVPGPVELLRGGQPGRPAADDGHALAGAHVRAARARSSLRRNRGRRSTFDLLDRHRIFVDSQHAGRFARGRTNAAGELRESCSWHAAARAPRASGRGTPGHSSRE